jgi:two-component system sensor histidine kinase CpxA
MKTLFAKIFIWFFLSLAVMILASYGMSRLAEMQRPESVVRHWGDPFRIHAEYAREALARDGREGLLRALGRMDAESRLHSYVIDRGGRELRGLPYPEGLDRLAREVLAGRGMGFLEMDRRPYFAYSLGGGADLDSSVLVLAPPPGPGRHEPFRLPRHRSTIIIGLIVIGGFLCYALARYVTSPVKRLRHAVRKLASGDLSARFEENRAMGEDELSSLGRDFNRMAERIESLVLSHRQLLRDVSHELRSPLARIRVALGLAQQQADPTQAQLLARIEHEAERLETLIAQVLTLSRLESGAGATTREPFDLGELVDGIAEDARFEAVAKGVEVLVTGAQDAMTVNGEVSVARSAIENVVRNAIRVSAAGSAVEIELGLRSDPEAARVRAVLRVLDRGPGVPEAELERIFEPFTRGEKARERMSGGVGLGLAIARRGIESHGGTILARAREGGGLVIEMEIPVRGPANGPQGVGEGAKGQ